MQDIFVLLLMSLAAYRLYRLFSIDAFPPIVWARKRFGRIVKRRFGEQWSAGVTCPWCAGFWWSLVVVLVVDHFAVVRLPVLNVLAVSCLVGLLAGLAGDGSEDQKEQDKELEATGRP
jgi:hypothetical protein